MHKHEVVLTAKTAQPIDKIEITEIVAENLSNGGSASLTSIAVYEQSDCNTTLILTFSDTEACNQTFAEENVISIKHSSIVSATINAIRKA